MHLNPSRKSRLTGSLVLLAKNTIWMNGILSFSTRSCGRSKQLDHMPIRIPQENLPGSIRPLLPGREISAHSFQMMLPSLDLIRSQREMVSVMAWKKWTAVIGDEVQLLIASQPKPGSGKIEGRPRNRLKL